MNERTSELLRYGANGFAATLIHYGLLNFNLNVLNFNSAALANFLAAIFAIAASFFGSRYFVFRASQQPGRAQAIKFVLLYGAIALVHAAVLLIWTDWLKMDFRIGFLIATLLQVSMSYIGNKRIVFNPTTVNS